MIGFIGGTGNQGRALALRLAASGEKVILGSRSNKKASALVKRITRDWPNLRIFPGTNVEAAKSGEIVFVTLPYKTLISTVKLLKDHLKGKIVVDVVNPLSKGPGNGESASEELQRILENSKVVCGFKNVSSLVISNIDEPVEVNSIVCSNFKEAKEKIIALSEQIGIPSIDGGGLENALASELLTKLLLELNKKYQAETGVKIVFHKA
jgi:NADPH-dependent F420 reductase